MEKILENLWVLFIGIGSWMINRMTSKIDALEKDKADANTTREGHVNQGQLIHELDRRVDENQHTSISRPEFKTDITALHTRLNEMERNKADKIKNIRTHETKEKNGEA